MKATELIAFLGKSIEDKLFLEFLEINNFNTKKFPNKKRGKGQGSKWLCPESKLHGIELRFGFEGSELNLQEIIFSKPQSNGLLPVCQIEYPFGLHLNQKIKDYSPILGVTIGFIEPQLQNYKYKNYEITLVFDPNDLDKKVKSIEIRIKK